MSFSHFDTCGVTHLNTQEVFVEKIFAQRNISRGWRGLAAQCALFIVCASGVASATTNNSGYVSSLQQSSSASLEEQIKIERGRLSALEIETRRDAVQKLGAMNRPQASRVASSALNDPATIVRATAARAILALPPDEAAALLIPLVEKDHNEFVRREAAYALGETKSASGVDVLIAALVRDREASVRGAAAVALGQIGDERAAVALSETLTRRIRASGLIGRALRRRTEENEFVRRAAARSLGQIKSRAGVLSLVAALENRKNSDDIRREAARSLGLIGDISAVLALRTAITASDPYLSEIAAQSLKMIERVARGGE